MNSVRRHRDGITTEEMTDAAAMMIDVAATAVVDTTIDAVAEMTVVAVGTMTVAAVGTMTVAAVDTTTVAAVDTTTDAGTTVRMRETTALVAYASIGETASANAVTRAASLMRIPLVSANE
jgi:hypothetical protein